VRLNSAVPSELQRIIEKAIEKDRKLRYDRAAELRTDLKITAMERKRCCGPPITGIPGH
jgi:hypothetical protein